MAAIVVANDTPGDAADDGPGDCVIGTFVASAVNHGTFGVSGGAFFALVADEGTEDEAGTGTDGDAFGGVATVIVADDATGDTA